jgi:PBSX family phage terminase large subunit
MTKLRIPTAPVFGPLLEPARYKGAYGGRGSGKSHFFGELMVERCLMYLGTLAVCIREVQKSLLQSSKRLIEDKIQKLGVGNHFKVLHDRIVTLGDGLIIFQGMRDSTAESIKSLEGFDVPGWKKHNHHRSLSLLRPTIRKDGSELWANWNPPEKAMRLMTSCVGNNRPTRSSFKRIGGTTRSFLLCWMKNAGSIWKSAQSITNTFGKATMLGRSRVPTSPNI